MPVTRKHSDACLFARHQTRVCSQKHGEQLERVAPFAEKDGVALATRREQPLAVCDLPALRSPVYSSMG